MQNNNILDKYFTSSDPHPGISIHIFWHIFCQWSYKRAISQKKHCMCIKTSHHICSGIQSGILSDILSGIRLICFWHSFYLTFYLTFYDILRSQSRSRSAHWDLALVWHLALAVEVRQCPLRCEASSWSEGGGGGGQSGEGHIFVVLSFFHIECQW